MELSQEARRAVDAALQGAESTEDAYGPSVQRLLHLLRTHLGMDAAWTSEFQGSMQIFRFVDVGPGKHGPEPGSRSPLSSAYCASVLAGKMPAIIPNSRAEPTASLLDITFELKIGAYLGVPLTAPDGTLEGMLCAISSGPLPGLADRDLASAKIIAELIEDLHRRALGSAEAARRREQLREEIESVCGGDGRWPVLQPIVHLATGDVFAAEGLTRFRVGTRTPAEWFAAAESVGLRKELELGTATAVLASLAGEDPPPLLAVNLSPDVVAGGCLDDLLAHIDPGKVIIEVTEHAPVPSYDELLQAIGPHRLNGLLLAVDDTGAGYASLTHVLHLNPDLMKIDMSLVRGIDGDPVRKSLVGAMAAFATDIGAMIVAEGVETEAELGALMEIGVPYGQGFVFGHPSERPTWSRYPVPGTPAEPGTGADR